MNFPKEIYSFIEEKKVNKIITRFPPEPNGYLHIGHVRAIIADFSLASKFKNSETILRFDDTNPTKENKHYVDNIISDLKWLGYTPSKITYSSDYFDILYELAIKLIKSGNAYVCDLSGDNISKYRNERKPSPYRNRTIEKNLKLFNEMRMGKYSDGSKTLRMKGDLESPEPCMWDLVFYRIMRYSHHRTGDKWIIYPTYDFTHCIVDSLENITVSMCSNEFITRRTSYFWLLDKLGMWKPYVYEFGKLNIPNSVLSKRNIASLIEKTIVEGWDDARLLTISGLRNRGFTPSSIMSSIEGCGLSKSSADLYFHNLEYHISHELDNSVPRRFVVIDPIKIKITNLEDNKDKIDCTLYDYPIFMRDIKEGKLEKVPIIKRVTRQNKLTNTIYISKTDYRDEDEKKYFGLAPDKIVRLRYGPFIKCVKRIDESTIEAIIVEPEKPKKVKGILSWVNSEAMPVQINTYDDLMIDGIINTDSQKVLTGLTEKNEHMNDLKRIQFERFGYCYLVEKSKSILVYNRIVELKKKFK